MVRRTLKIDELGRGRIIEEKEKRKKIREGREENITVIKNVSDVLRTSLGPDSMKKMLVDPYGEVIVTDDGSLMLEEMEIEHPAAKMLVELGKELRDIEGDGSTRAVVLSGMLLKKARDLILSGIHPTTIINGYNIASSKGREILDEIAMDIDIERADYLKKIAFTSICGLENGVKKKISSVAVEAVKTLIEENDGRKEVKTKNVCIERAIGGITTDFVSTEGVVINRERIGKETPKRIKDARIALLNSPIEVKLRSFQEKFNIKEIEFYAKESGMSPMKALLDKIDENVREMIRKLCELGVNVVLTRKGIDEVGRKYLADKGIFSAKRVELKYLENLEDATGGKISDINDLSEEDIGTADIVEERRVGNSSFIFVTGCPYKKFFSVIIRGGTLQVLNELQRKVLDTIKVLGSAVENKKVLAGGGSMEVELAKRMRKVSASIKGREQIAFESYINALEEIPKLLATNSGMNPLDKLIELTSYHEMGNENYGINEDMLNKGIIEPISIEKKVISSATEVAGMILKIDDIIRMKSKPGSTTEKERPPEITGGMLTSDIQQQQMVRPHPDTPEYVSEYMKYHPRGLWDARQRMREPYWREEKSSKKWRGYRYR